MDVAPYAPDVARLAGKGAKAIGKGVGEAMSQFAPSGSGPKTLASQVGAIKPKGGNWFKDEVENKLERLKFNNREINPSLFEGFEQSAKDPTDPLQERSIRRLREHNDEIALNNWVDKNLTNYVKKELGTPEDPVRLAIDSRVAEANKKFKVDMDRANKVAQRAKEETDPRRQANFQREANRLTAEANNNLELGIKHSSHLPHDPDYFTSEDIKSLGESRKEQGFPAEGMGKSDEAKAYEMLADTSIYPLKARSFQELPERVAQAELAKKEAEQAKINLDAKLTKHLESKLTGVTDQQIKNLVNGMGFTEKEQMIGDDSVTKAYQKLHALQSPTDDYKLKRLENNPYINKLAPDTNIYSAQTGDLGFDHIIDVLKEDLASGRLTSEELKNISMEQAVRKTADYDLALAKKMQEAQAKNLESMTVHKEYPEGMKWVQLDKPGQFSAESNAMGHSVRGYEPPQGHLDWIPESGDSGSLGYGHGGWEAIKSGKAKVYSLVDPKGNPHTTVEVASGRHPIGYGFKGATNEFPENFDYNLNFDEGYPRPTLEQKQAILNRAKELYSKNPAKLLGGRLERMDAFQKASDEVLGLLPAEITQIKGKSNLKPVDTYIPYVQDFVKSGEWSDVGDLHNTDLTKIYPESDLAKSLAQKGISVPSYTTSEELTNLLKQAEVGSYRDASKGKTWINDEHPDYRNDVPPVEATPNIPPPETPQFKRGGKVHITDNLDTQWAETAFKPHMAVGGEFAKLVEKAIEKAIKIPTKFERATPLTKEAIDAMAERMAPQVTGEFVRAKPTASQPNPSTSVTGKSQKQFESEKNLGLVTRDIKPPVKPREFDYTDPKNKGKVLIGTSGDVTPTNKEILEIKGVPIEPTEQQGGAEYGLYNPAIYAASNDQAQAYQAQAKRASEAYGDAEPLLHYHRMTDDANWYAMHHLQTLLNYMKPEELAKIDPSKYGQLVKLIQEKDVGFGLHPQFGGFEDPLSINLHAQIDPDFRRHVGKILQMPSISQNFGLRSGLDVLAATSEPELRNLEAGAGGFAIAPIDIKTPYTPYTSPNRTYETDILGGEVKRSKYPVPYQLAYPDATQFLIENPPQKGANNVFGRLNFTKPRQIIDQQFQDEVGQYMDKMKELTGKKEGGEVHMAGGGSASKALEAMLAEAPELANTIRGLFKAEAPTLGSLVDKLRTPDRQSVLPMPNRWFLDPENHPEVQGLVQKVLDVNGMNRSDFHSGAYVDPKTGKIIDTQIHKDVGVAIDPITNRPVMTTGGLTGMESLPKDQGSFTNSNLLKQGKYKPVGGDSILNDLGFIATVDKAGMGHAYGLGTDYASPVLLNNLGTGSNPTLRPRSVGDVFGIGDVVGQMQINKNSPVHDVYEKLLVAPKGSDVQGVKLSKKKGGKVQITNNPDTQWAELQFQRK